MQYWAWKTKVLLHTGKAKHLTFYRLWCRCGATPQYEEGQNGRRVGFPDYTSLMICCNTSNFLEYTEFLWLGETALRPLQRNLVGSWILLLKDCEGECETSTSTIQLKLILSNIYKEISGMHKQIVKLFLLNLNSNNVYWKLLISYKTALSLFHLNTEVH